MKEFSHDAGKIREFFVLFIPFDLSETGQTSSAHTIFVIFTNPA
jgi:hypothetical protein